jgi:hypothetical protein
MNNSNIMIVVKKDIANTSQATTIWALAGEWHKTMSRFSAKAMVISQKLSEISMW